MVFFRAGALGGLEEERDKLVIKWVRMIQGEELRLLEEAANAKYGAYKSALDVTAELEGNMDGLKADIEAMGKQLAEEQGNISVYTDRQAKAVALKASTK